MSPSLSYTKILNMRERKELRYALHQCSFSNINGSITFTTLYSIYYRPITCLDYY
jgi:hypothetical protein